MKNKKTALTKSLIALLLCIAMLIGSTYAWFTDNVTSAGNIIKSGKLELAMYWTDDPDSGVWHDVEDPTHNTIFSYEKWEPGYTDVKYVKLVNKGNLALNYSLTLAPQNGVGKLAEVINVYFAESEVALQQRSDLSNLRAIGLLSNVLNGGATAEGTLLAPGQQSPLHPNGSEVIMTLAMSMITTAGNDYQQESSVDFTVTALATQASFEEDSFGSSYDSMAEYPPLLIANSVSAAVTPVNGKVPAGGVTMSKNGIAAYVPAGVSLEDGTDKLTLSITPLADSGSGITTLNNEILIPVDVHIEGVAEDNTVPIIIDLGEVLPKYLNMGNYHLVHVEDGTNAVMTLVDSEAELTAHNRFTYDPLTGAVSVAMASFSEVALVVDTSKPWEGGEDYDWYTDEAVVAKHFEIANADQLYAFSKIVGGMASGYAKDDFDGDTIKLLSDVNLNHGNFIQDGIQKIFYPIGYYNNKGQDDRDNATGIDGVESNVSSFSGTFDGNGNTISNFYQNTWEMFGDYNSGYPANSNYYKDAMGLFGYVNGGTVKNLTVDHFESDGEFTPTGVIAAYAADSTFENIAITNCNPRVYNTGNGGIVGIGGNSGDTASNKLTFNNITIDNTNKISALWGSWDVACGGMMGMFRGNGLVDFNNCHVAAQIDVNNDVCANYQYYWYRYSGMFIGSVRKNTTEGKYTVADTTGITATDSTYTLGKWNQYWYCELVANSLASYTHDHQFSRLTPIEKLSDIKNGDTWLKSGNFVLPAADNSSAECYHIFKDAEGNLYQHFHNVADDTNPAIYEKTDLNGDGELNDLKEDRTCYFMPFNQILNGDGYGVKAHYEFDGITVREDGLDKSEVKFESTNLLTYRPGQTIKLGDLFAAIVDESKISKATLYAAVSPATESDKVNATYTINEGNWANGTITFDASCEGSAKLVITDYFYCTPTVIYLNPEQATEKFTANSISAQNAYTQITLGTLFSKKDGAKLGAVTATVTDPNGNETTISGTDSDWDSKSIALTKDGTWTVAIKDDDSYCKVTSVQFTVNKVNKFETNFTGDFLHRIGNANTVAWSKLFNDLSPAIAPVGLKVTVAPMEGNAAGTFTNGSIQFTGTGVVKVTISADGANDATLNLEVVDATNITKAEAGTDKNFVLLQDVTYNSGYLYYKNSTLYGNGFTVDITGADHSDLRDSSDTSSNKSAYCNIWMVESRFDNVQIKGSVYPEVGMTADSDYGNAAIRTEGECYITNSYISNCRVPLRIQGNTTLIDTVVDGGRYANIELRSGKLTLDGVTTINTVRKGSDGKEDVIGFGIVIHSEAANASIAVIGDGLKQYNWVGENKHKSILSGDTNLSSAYKLIFNANNSDSIYFDHDNDRYVNTGILCLCADINKDAVTGLDDRYCQGVSGYDAWVLTYDNSKHTDWFGSSVSQESVDFVPAQYPIIPNYSGNEAQFVEFTKGETYYFDTSVLSAKKFGETLTVSSVAMNGTTYNYGDKISITEGGVYEVVYTVVDPYNYSKDASSITTVNHNVSITLTAVVKDAEILAPKFTFIDQNGNKYESTTVKAGEKTYVMPNVTAADPTTNSMSSINIGSASISGTTVYFPVATGYTVRSGSNFNRYYPLFNGINITDYTITGDMTGTTYTTSDNYTSLVGSSGTKFIIPANGGQTNCGDYVKTDGQAGNAAGNSDSGWQGAGYSTSYGGTYLKSGNTNASSGADKNGYERIVWVEYCFNAGNGDVYYYRIGYHCNKESAQTCVTPDTLVTLADGSQKRVDSLSGTEKLLVWNHETGKLDIAPVAYVVDHDGVVATREIIHLAFSNGKTVKIIGEHVFFDATQKKYVAIDTNNADAFVGHSFVALDVNGTEVEKVKLVSVERTVEETLSYEVVSYKHLTCFTEGILSTSAYLDSLLNVFDVEVGSLAYSIESVQKDIETYGLYTYADFEGLISEEAFELYNAQYLKIAVGKGYITWDDILALIDIYFNVDVQPIQ